MDDIKFDPDGFVFVRVYIRPKNTPSMKYIDFKVDTGANCTTISHERLVKLGYDRSWIKSGILLEGDSRPTVASGLSVEDCYQVILPEIRIGDWVGYNWPMITSLSVPFKFLLGTDSMRFFDWHFKYGQGVCKFNLIPGKRKLLFNRQEQSIHALDDIKKE